MSTPSRIRSLNQLSSIIMPDCQCWDWVTNAATKKVNLQSMLPTRCAEAMGMQNLRKCPTDCPNLRPKSLIGTHVQYYHESKAKELRDIQ